MSFGSFLSGIYHAITPWHDSGSVFSASSYQPQRKKRPEDQPGYQPPRPQAPPQQFNNQPQVQRPDNLFQGLNQNLMIGANRPGVVPVFKTADIAQGAVDSAKIAAKPRTPEDDVNDGLNAGKSWEQISRETNVPLDQVQKYSQATRPSYGMPAMAKPKQGFFNKIRDVFDANTQADQYRRQQGNNNTRLATGQVEKPIVLKNPGNIISRTPIIGNVTKMINTGINQVRQIPATIEGAVYTHMESNLTKQMMDAQKSGDTIAYEEAKRKLNLLAPVINKTFQQQNADEARFQENHGGLFNVGSLYNKQEAHSGDIKTGIKKIAVPTATSMLDLYTLGQGSAISAGLKEGIPAVGLRTAVRDVAPNIVRAGVGNYASGDISARGAGATNEQAVKSGLINSILGFIPDVGLPALGSSFKNRVLPAILRGRNIPASVVDQELADAAASAGGETASQALRPRVIPVRQGIPINEVTTGASRIPVSVAEKTPGKLIQEITGDAATATPKTAIMNRVIAARHARANAINKATVPDRTIEGVTPRAPEQPFNLTPEAVATGQEKVVQDYADMLRSLDEGNGVDINKVTGTRMSNNFRPGMGSGNITKAQWLDEARRQLENGQAASGVQQAFNDAASPEVQSMLAKGEQPPAPEGSPIAVKQVTGIPVTDQTVVPQGLPETPGTVRATVQTSPMAAKSEAVANAPVVVRPAQLPAETQAILDNPKQFTKRQVTAARNQRKLAKQLAKTQADTQAVIDNSPQLAPKLEGGTPGFVPTGEFRRGVNRNVSEVAHQSTEAAQAAADTANLSSGDVLARATKDITETGTVAPESVRNLQAMLDSGRFAATSPEYRVMAKTLYGAGSDYGRGLSLFNPTMRRTASGDQLANRFISKLYGVTEDPAKLTDAHFSAVQTAENQFTAARDAANQALDRYNATKSAGDFAAWKQARQVADDAEKHSLITEYKIANDVLKGNKSPEALKAIQKAEKNAGVYQMDWIDANMLSGTGTMTRNLMNTTLVRMENRLFGGRGYSSRGAKIGSKIGNRSVITDFKARNELDQGILSKTVKQWTTTGNMLGEGNISAVGSARAYKYYADQLKAKGITGNQLKMDTETMLHTDPEGMAKHFEQWSLTENALSSMYHSRKIEQAMVDAIASKGGGKLSQNSAKALVRLTVGFPTVIGRSLYGGVKRATFGVPDLIAAGRAFAKGDTLALKDALYTAKVHAGSGAALYALGTGLAEAGLITPAYPTDPAEQAKWKAEGKQPNSLNIGGQWFSIPGYFGALALPLLVPANVINKTSPGDIVKGVINGVQDLSPTAGIQNFVDGIEGRGGKQWVKNEVTSLTRAFTPVGSLLNQIAKMTDPTKNDTTTKDAIHNLLDSIASGIPGVNNMVNKIPATDANGNILHNPNPAATFLGAQGSVQPQGQQDVQQAQNAANDTYKKLSDYGILQNKDLMGLVDKKIQAQIERGQDLTPEQVKSVQDAVVKGVSTTGEDTAYLERGQYDANLAVLKVKHDLMSSDPTVKPSSLKDLELAIKRGQFYKDNQTPYSLISDYKGTSLTEWRHMGDPKDDAYDPKMYEKLWNIDQKLTKIGGSYKTGSPEDPKYSAKKPGTGRGGRGGVRKLDTSFGTLKAGIFAPRVQQYDTIDTKSGAIPHISVIRPNIVHKISSSG